MGMGAASLIFYVIGLHKADGVKQNTHNGRERMKVNFHKHPAVDFSETDADGNYHISGDLFLLGCRQRDIGE
jgi:uncharacterized heparinase superfamily protein